MKKGLNFDKITMGVCYYPEHWDPGMWREDLDRMLSCGISVVRIAEFAWNCFEPEDGQYTFALFDSFMEICSEVGMKVIFCTPTATPPVWLSEKYPEILNADIDGNLLYPGIRRHYNMNSPVYREYTRRITEKLAEHYAGHPCVIGWQLDNEINCEINKYYSESDHKAFREYMKRKYKTLDALNEAMGTIVWNQTYTDWEQVHLKRRNPHTGETNPHMQMEEDRFIADTVYDYFKLQADIIRKWQAAYGVEDRFITTNGLFGIVDYHRLVGDVLDFICFDNYPAFSFAVDRDPKAGNGLKDRNSSFNLTRTRSISANFGIMEQQSGAGGWNCRMKMPMPKPGQMRLWALQRVAHGADFVSFFRWRTARVGTEIYWHGLLDYDNRDNRRIRELKQFGEDIEKLASLAGSKVRRKVAILMDYDNEWDSMHDIWHGPSAAISHDGWFCYLEKNHIPFDFVYVNDNTTAEDLADYEAVIYPHATIFTPARHAAVKAYLEQGGKAIFGCRGGYKTPELHCLDIPMPGLIADLCGAYVQEYTCLSPFDDTLCITCGGKTAETAEFVDMLEVTDGEVYGTFSQPESVEVPSHFVGTPAIVGKKVGEGRCYYLGSAFKEDMAGLAAELLELQADELPVELPAELEIVVREDAGANYYFILNYAAKSGSVQVKKPLTDMLTGETVCGEAAIGGYDVLILKEEK